jgi:uncharacterized protein (TIGR00369 family)
MMAIERRGPFWDVIEGRLPAPPAARLLGWKLELEGRNEFLNPVGSIQGGILAAMLDDTLGPAAAALLGGEAFAQTLELKTSFLRPARPGKLYGDGRVVHRGRDIVFLEGSLSTAEGTVVATATATARVIPFQALRSSA